MLSNTEATDTEIINSIDGEEAADEVFSVKEVIVAEAVTVSQYDKVVKGISCRKGCN